jgi:hypothetical protein
MSNCRPLWQEPARETAYLWRSPGPVQGHHSASQGWRNLATRIGGAEGPLDFMALHTGTASKERKALGITRRVVGCNMWQYYTYSPYGSQCNCLIQCTEMAFAVLPPAVVYYRDIGHHSRVLSGMRCGDVVGPQIGPGALHSWQRPITKVSRFSRITHWSALRRAATQN